MCFAFMQTIKIEIDTMLANASAKVVPGISQKAVVWKEMFMAILKEILGGQGIVKKYKHGLGARIGAVVMTGLCATTCCSPCVLWDCLCCCLTACVCKKNPFNWGTGFKFIEESCNETFYDERKETMKQIGARDLPKHVFMSVIDAYMMEFDKLVAMREAGAAKKANQIRAMAVHIIANYSPGYKYMNLKDDGNVEKLREIIKEIPSRYDLMHF